MDVIDEAFFPQQPQFFKDTIQQLVKILGSIQGNDIFFSLLRNAEDRSRDLEDTPA